MFWLPLVMSSLVVVHSTKQCQKDKSTVTIWGRYLKGHVISSENVKNIGMCYMQCSMDQRCKSINFLIGDLPCELNDADRHTHPWDYVLKKDHSYIDYPVKVPFREYVMTPSWLETNAADISSARSMTTDQMTFNAGSIKFERLLKVPLVAAGVLADNTPLTVEITVAVDASIGQESNSDPNYGLSDGTNFIGFETVDQANYFRWAPCTGSEATSGEAIASREYINAHTALIPKDSHFPDQFGFTFQLDQPWGSCFTAHGGGYTNSVEYSKQLMVSQGLALEVYKGTKEERLGIKFIKVTIMKTDE
ncbi:uncharacterized protein LOC144663674 [Oculina patagonica]